MNSLTGRSPSPWWKGWPVRRSRGGCRRRWPRCTMDSACFSWWLSCASSTSVQHISGKLLHKDLEDMLTVIWFLWTQNVPVDLILLSNRNYQQVSRRSTECTPVSLQPRLVVLCESQRNVFHCPHFHSKWPPAVGFQLSLINGTARVFDVSHIFSGCLLTWGACDVHGFEVSAFDDC